LKRYAIFFSFLLLFLVLITPPTTVSLTVAFHKRWALIMTTHPDFQPSLDAWELKETLEAECYYNFDDVRYMTYVDKQDVREAIKTWKSGNTKSDSDDLLFIFIESHGGGYCAEEGVLYGPPDKNLLRDGSRGDPKDEGDEFRETDVKLDFDGDGVLESNVWGGIDECIVVRRESAIPEYYWDDEVKEDLDYLAQNGKYGRLVFLFGGCKFENSSDGCFGGGYIRELSASNRIIITPSDETTLSHGDWTEDGYAYMFFSRPFVEALRPGTQSFQEADISGDGAVSIWEAFRYAWENDVARIDGRETPQLDDNGDSVANSGDGLLAYRTLLITERPKSTDINWDGRVGIIDLSTVAKAWFVGPGHPLWNPWANMPPEDNLIDIYDAGRVGMDWDKKYLDIGWTQPTGTPKMTVYPNQINVPKHQTFSVDVTITDVYDLYCYQFKLYYKTAVLNCTGVSLPSGQRVWKHNPTLLRCRNRQLSA